MKNREQNVFLYPEIGNLNEKIIISDTILSLASPSSVDTDMLSSLGVRMKEFPDPLAGWEDLEPELQARRRSSHADNVFLRYVRHILFL